MAYISVIETGNANLTCKNIDFIAKNRMSDIAILTPVDYSDRQKT